jgi:hypothetical protein
LVDPDGRSPEDHIFYLAIQKGANVDIESLKSETQKMLDHNGINQQVQVIEVGDDGFKDKGFSSKLDKTDALTFFGDKAFVEGISDRKFTLGYQTNGVGFVNIDVANKAVKGSDNPGANLARAGIHEGVGHNILGAGHPDEGTSDYGIAEK